MVALLTKLCLNFCHFWGNILPFNVLGPIAFKQERVERGRFNVNIRFLDVTMLQHNLSTHPLIFIKHKRFKDLFSDNSLKVFEIRKIQNVE
jgi:hypothetical protein